MFASKSRQWVNLWFQPIRHIFPKSILKKHKKKPFSSKLNRCLKNSMHLKWVSLAVGATGKLLLCTEFFNNLFIIRLQNSYYRLQKCRICIFCHSKLLCPLCSKDSTTVCEHTRKTTIPRTTIFPAWRHVARMETVADDTINSMQKQIAFSRVIDIFTDSVPKKKARHLRAAVRR